MIKTTVAQIKLRTIDDIEYVDLLFRDGSEMRVKGPRSGMRVNERRVDNDILIDVEFEGFELVD